MRNSSTNRMNKLSVALAAVVAIGFSAPTLANEGMDKNKQMSQYNQQSDRYSQSRYNNQNMNQSRSQYGQSGSRANQDQWALSQGSSSQLGQGQQRQFGQQSQSGQQNVRLDPQGWISVAYDYDQDNRIDAVETVYAYDIEQAQKRSDERKKRSAQSNRGQQSRYGQSGQQSRQGQSGQGQSGQGRVQPEGFVQIAYDYDRDERIDAVETIYAYDLQNALQKSKQRRGQMSGQASRSGQQQSGMRGQQANQQFGAGQQYAQNQSGQWGRQQSQFGQQNRYGQSGQYGQQSRYGQQGQSGENQWSRQQNQLGQQSRFGQSGQQQGLQQSRFGQNNQYSQQGRFGQQGQQQQWQRSQQQSQFQQQRQVSGTIQDKDEFQLAGMNQQHTFVKIRTSAGQTERVDLGPSDQVDRLNLRNGTQITVSGTRGTVNGRSIIMANNINANNQNQRVQRQQNKQDKLQRVSGRLSNVRTAQLRGFANESLVGTLNRDDGRTAAIILGPKDDLQEVDLSQGDRITALVHPITLNNRLAFAASQFTANDKFVQVDRPQQRDRYVAQRQQNFQNQQRNQGQQQWRNQQNQRNVWQ